MINLFLILVLTSLPAFAQSDSKGGGGGDECESRFKEITVDLRDWILRGGSKQLVLTPPLTLEEYEEKFVQLTSDIIDQAAGATQIECTSERVFVNGIEKTCRWSRNNERAKIVCNQQRFLIGQQNDDTGLQKADAQYQLVHHEYAGILGFELNRNDSSSYAISNQIVASLENQLVRKLAIKTSSTGTGMLVPEGAIISKSDQFKSIEFSSYPVLTDSYYHLHPSLVEKVQKKCDEKNVQYTIEYFSNFQQDDLVPGKDVIFNGRVSSVSNFSVEGQVSAGCRHYLEVKKLGYMITKLDLEFINVESCLIPIERTNIWAVNSVKNFVKIAATNFKVISNKEARQRSLPKKTPLCIIQVLKIDRI